MAVGVKVAVAVAVAVGAAVGVGDGAAGGWSHDRRRIQARIAVEIVGDPAIVRPAPTTDLAGKI